MKKIVFIICIMFLFACSKKEGHKNQVEKEESFSDTSLSGVYKEEYEEDYATIIEFNEDLTFTSKLNICNAMIQVNGTYTIKKNKISLSFPDKTGFDFIDENQPYEFDIINDELVQEKVYTPYSCAYINKYKKVSN